jgi:hypothetical protein
MARRHTRVRNFGQSPTFQAKTYNVWEATSVPFVGRRGQKRTFSGMHGRERQSQSLSAQTLTRPSLPKARGAR